MASPGSCYRAGLSAHSGQLLQRGLALGVLPPKGRQGGDTIVDRMKHMLCSRLKERERDGEGGGRRREEGEWVVGKQG